MKSGESNNSGATEPEINEFRTETDENEEIENESGDLNSQDGEEDDEEVELSPKLAEGFFEIETVRRKRVRKGQVQYLIKWRGWPETANTWEPYENLVSCFDVIEAFEEGLRSGKHRSRKRKRRSSGLVPQAKKKTQGTPGASTSSPLTVGRVFDEGDYIIPFVCDVSHENNGGSGMGDSANDEVVEQGNRNGSVAIPSRVEEKDQNETDVNQGESTGIQSTNGGSSLLAINNLESQICFGNGHPKVDGEALVQANGRLRKRRKAASVKRFSQEQTLQAPLVTNYAAIEQGNGNVPVDIPPQVEEGRDNNEICVNPGEFAGTQLINWGSSRMAVDILEPKTSETICFEIEHQKVDEKGLAQANGRSRNRRKAASVKRFSQEQTPRVTNYGTVQQGNGNGSSDIRPQVEKGRDHYEIDVNPGEYAGALTNGGSSRVAVDILESQPSEAICFENGHRKVDGEGLVQGNGRLKNRRKAASVKRFNQEQTPCVTNYAAPDLTPKNTHACGIARQNWDKNSVQRSKSDDNSTESFSITEIIKPISFSSSGSVPDILVTFMAKRSDGKEVMVDNKYLKANYPLLLINYYEQHLNYNATAGLDRSGREYMAG
ncbi:hypothetical protein POM88_012760 [Heracleum sosnowskyi]|uniref:Chromo domain-containing protein n=1 Tax=Heracleum sosnowskyi TaxID=360622 RepID=A0AAD8IYS5_9APIA|nr:hypothetical protein POM88_012760 [Heracleum sosnowskyi]